MITSSKRKLCEAEEGEKKTPLILLTRLPGVVPQPLFLVALFFFEVVFQLKKFEVVSHFQKYGGCLPFSKKLRLSSIFENIIVLTFKFFWLHNFFLGHLPFLKTLWSSSFKKKMEVVLRFQKY
jgi:hypothetical protein